MTRDLSRAVVLDHLNHGTQNRLTKGNTQLLWHLRAVCPGLAMNMTF